MQERMSRLAATLVAANLLGQLVHHLVDRCPVIRDRCVDADEDRLPRQRQRCFSGVTIVMMVEREAELTLVGWKIPEDMLDQRHVNHPRLAVGDFRPLFGGGHSLVERRDTVLQLLERRRRIFAAVQLLLDVGDRGCECGVFRIGPGIAEFLGAIQFLFGDSQLLLRDFFVLIALRLRLFDRRLRGDDWQRFNAIDDRQRIQRELDLRLLAWVTT